MKETGVLFNLAMSAALRREVDPKTQTRRVVKPQPHHLYGAWPYGAPDPRYGVPDGGGQGYPPIACPYGAPGDLLWARETFFAFGRWVTRFSEAKGRDEWSFVDMTLETGRAYLFDEPAGWVRRQRAAGGATPGWWKRPSIHMPRVASRITLEVTGVRVERLWQISVGDVMAEGCPHEVKSEAAAVWYRSLWEQLNGPGSWDANPWVWVVEFRRV